MENGIAALREVEPADLVARLGVAVDEHLAQLRGIDLEPEPVVDGTLGSPVPLARFLPIRVLDVWTHGEDVRRAVGGEPSTTGLATQVARDQTMALLPYFAPTGRRCRPGRPTRSTRRDRSAVSSPWWSARTGPSRPTASVTTPP